MTRHFLALPLILCLGACATQKGPEAPVTADFAAEIIDLKGKEGPPKGPKGACWYSDVNPAVIETVAEQVMIRAEVRNEAREVVQPAAFSTETRQKIVEERKTIWFRAPCAKELTPEFIATVQRALKARGLYLANVTGTWNKSTREAVRRYQTQRGLPSGHLSLAAARDLGLIAIER